MSAAAAAADRVTAPFGRRAASLTAIERHGAYTVLRCSDPGAPRPQAGQFYMLAARERWGGGEDERPYLPRAFSVLRAPEGSHELHFLLEDVGPGTRRLCRLRAGEALLLVGPLGTGFRSPAAGRVPVLVGGGVGIAPLAIWQDRLAAQSGTCPRALLGFRDRARAAGATLLQRPVLATDDGSVGHRGPVTELLAAELERLAQLQVYACGPPAMLEAVRALCAAGEVPVQLALESGMACGFGACFGCAVPTRRGLVRLCLDGPVLEGELLDSALVPGAGH